MRPYRHPDDYGVVDRFLIDIYDADTGLVNWLQPRWEYMHSHANIENVDLHAIGLAEDDDGSISGMIHPEHAPAFCYVQVRPGCDHIKPMLVDWAEAHLGGWSRTFERDMLGIHVDATDGGLQAILRERGYVETPEWGEQHASLDLDRPVPAASVPDGFTLQSLADENDFTKINRVLWRGFNHEGPPPAAEIPGRQKAQATPNYRKDLNIVAVASDGSYVSYAGIWYVPENKVSYVEPVATDPSYRRRGLGRAVVLEAVRRTERLGSKRAWVGSDQLFYQAMGFEVVSRSSLWHRARTPA